MKGTINQLPKRSRLGDKAMSVRNHATRFQRRRPSYKHRRRGGAIADLAVCLPVVVLLIVGSIEACSMMFVKQSLHIAAYEGIRRAVTSGASAESAIARAEQILSERHVNDAQLELIPQTVDQVNRGNDVVIRVTAPVQSNSLMRLNFFKNNLVVEATMVKE